ncbi:calcium-binding protein [Sphingomonas sabuli]|uniref:Calcium-binding protein n=1 Tax=Sphingomonas sabuli TaxID=2764186 RepID=A0A7G9L4I3_9SPHN|nr:calcium-binding protein [Sphingomonas sabuli]QNM83532.1 calcium-binding protein [Sphingomonas sabuli]
MPTFTTGNDTHVVDYLGTYSLSLLAGNDTLTLASGATIVAHLDDGNDLVTIGADAGPYRVYGDNGSDTFDLFSGNGSVNGGAGNNVFNIRGGTGHDLSGGAEIDTFTFFANVEDILIRGGSGNDVLNGGNRVITGSLYGGAGSDYFLGFTTYGAVTLYGGLDNDIYRIAANHSDVRIVEYYNQGDDLIQLPGGMDYILPANVENLNVGNFAGSTGADAEISGNGLANRILGGDNAETVLGRGGDDDLRGNGGDDVLDGSAGNDSLEGGLGSDTLLGGTGNDILNGQGGLDVMIGGTGNDLYFVDDWTETVVEYAGQGTDTIRTTVTAFELSDTVENLVYTGLSDTFLYGNPFANVITGGSGNDMIESGDGADTVSGGAGDDLLIAGFADDVVYGGADNDELQGNTGNDILEGGAGVDRLIGGIGGDTLTGGGGADTFYFGTTEESPFYVFETTYRPYDIITDFRPDGAGSADVINIELIDANINVAGNQAFMFSGNTADAYSVWISNFQTNADGTYDLTFRADVNGDTTAEFELVVHTFDVPVMGIDFIL